MALIVILDIADDRTRIDASFFVGGALLGVEEKGPRYIYKWEIVLFGAGAAIHDEIFDFWTKCRHLFHVD